jgi:ferredoxin
MGELWTLGDLKSWVTTLLGQRRVVAPVDGPSGAVWSEIKSPDSIAWDYGRTSVSPRSWLLPRSEPLFRYDLAENPPKIEEVVIDAPRTVLFLLRSCDVAGVRALDAVMRWDYTDEPFEERRAATLLVSLGCAQVPSPESCFCTAVGLDPRWAPGADVAIERVEEKGEARFRVVALTEAGKASLQGAPKPLADGGPVGPPVQTQPLDLDRARAWMREHFDDPLWEEASEACLGCGACAFVCPSCHCFDVVDEGDWRRGERVRNWDSCAFGHFTLHATGHNPRPRQSSRYRQRVYHKFIYYPDKFGHMLCTGCGRCVDDCPGGMDLIEILQGCAAKEGSPA